VLRDELGFVGVIISDAMDMSAIAQGRGLLVDALAAVAASVDLLLLKEDPAMQQEIYAGLLQAAQRGLLAPSDVLASVERVLALKRWLAEQPQPPLEVVGSAEHLALADEIAARSVTLVRDDARLLPLRPAPGDQVAVIVPQTADLTPADTSSYVTCTLAEELRRYHPGVDEYVVPHHPAEADIAALRERMGGYQLAIVGTINATAAPAQAALVETILATGTPLIAVGLRMPYDLEVYPAAQTYACTYSILPPSMAALARALLGHIPFAGRLPVSIPNLYALGHAL
jgi:beta-N-acetylhexosaminidase